MPESPRFLLTTGKYDEALKLLEKVAQDNKSDLPPGKLIPVEKNVRDHSNTQSVCRYVTYLFCH